MVNTLARLYELSKNDKKAFLALKNVAVMLQDFQAASEFREVQNDLWPESPEITRAKTKATQLNVLFRMVNLNVDEPTCWLISEVLSLYNKKKGAFSLEDAADIIAKKQKIFE
jgi:hypothetical protein